jgi:glucokinase
MNKVCLGIDLGGTFIKFALLDETLRMVGETASVPTPANQGAGAVIAAMVAGGKALLARHSDVKCLGVGIGSPGPLDLANGVVIGMPNIPGFENVPLRDRVGAGLGLPATLENDANAAALGEYIAGSGAGSKLLVMLTLGTGLGSGIIIDGKVLHGAHGIGAEVGHLIVEPDGEPCGCGQRGCLERYSSATYLARRAQSLVESGRASSLAAVLKTTGQITSLDVLRARNAGDALAAEVWDRAIHLLAIGCVSLCRVLDPDLIVIGGGMAKAGDDLMVPLRQYVQQEHWKLSKLAARLELAKLGNDAGVIGAAGQAWAVFH